MDRWGNPLASLDSPNPATQTFEFDTSHVRILFPFHDPFNEEPDNWFGQIRDLNENRNYMMVETTDKVTRLEFSSHFEHILDVPIDSIPGQNNYTLVDFDRRIDSETDGSSEIHVCSFGPSEDGSGQEVEFGCDKMSVLVPPPKRVNIVTYNAARRKHPPPSGLDWRTRLTNFVNDVVVPYRPAIIAIQEIDTSDSEYMQYLMNEIYLGVPSTRRHYFIANIFATGAGGSEGEAVIYDASQVSFLPSGPFGSESSCPNLYLGDDSYYEYYQEEIACLLTGSGNWGEVSRAIFEFPKYSGEFFNLFNTHMGLPPCYLDTALEYTIGRQNELQDELDYLLRDDPAILDPEVLQPVFAGDMNTVQLSNCSSDDYARIIELINWYNNYPSPSMNHIDKVWVGKLLRFGGEPELLATDDQNLSDAYPFSIVANGYCIWGDENIYSDHSPCMIEMYIEQ